LHRITVHQYILLALREHTRNFDTNAIKFTMKNLEARRTKDRDKNALTANKVNMYEHRACDG